MNSLKLAPYPMIFFSDVYDISSVTVAEMIICVHIHPANQNGFSERTVRAKKNVTLNELAHRQFLVR